MVVKERLDVQPLALPVELRHTIHEMALGPDTYPHARWVDYTEAEGSLVLGSHHMMQSSIIAKNTADYNIIVAPPPNTNFLLVNRQVHEEAPKIGWESARKCFN